MRGRDRHSSRLYRFSPERTRNLPERECYAHKSRLEIDESGEAIINRNLSKLHIELDFTDLDSIGTNAVLEDGVVKGRQDMLAAKMIVNWKTGEITDIGNEKYLDPASIYSENAIPMDLIVLINYPELHVEGQPNYSFQLMEIESPSGNTRIPLASCMTEVAATNLAESFNRSSAPELG